MTPRQKRAISGILVIDKPEGMSSNACLQKVKYLYRATKAGHTGSLDPLATGVLPLCLGEATKVSQFLLDADKEYVTTIRLGCSTSTGDSEGEVLEQKVVPELELQAIAHVLQSFLGISNQTPPVYSALKQNGVPLYKLARQGKVVQVQPRAIMLYELELTEWQLPLLSLRVRCSKGTYIRSLAEDIARALGTVGHVAVLRRLQSGPFSLSASHTLDELALIEDVTALDDLLLPMDMALGEMPMVAVAADQATRLQQGQQLQLEKQGKNELVRIYLEERFLGIGTHLEDGRLRATRLLST